MTLDMLPPVLSEYTDDEKLIKLAEASLAKFEEISSTVNEKLKTYHREGVGNVFASHSDESRAYSSLSVTSSTMQEEYRRLAHEPAIARIVFQCVETKEIKTFYVCRNYTPPPSVKNAISYRSPMGRLAALKVGETYDLGEETGFQKYDEQDIFKVQHVTFIPVRKGEFWDSRKSEYQDFLSKGIITIDSLRSLLEEPAESDEDILATILAEETRKENITSGMQRDILESLSLRDQPLLDQYQDEIFRLPLQHSLLLLGPAGSGKTTTLIRRLGQKLDRETGLTDGERRLVESLSEADKSHETSWLMFTPTELLKSYLQEAFSREEIPAPDRNITTWEATRHHLGRNIFKILHTPNFESGLQFDSNALTLLDGKNNSIDIFRDFYAWLIEDYAKDILSTLSECSSVERLKNDKTLSVVLGFAQKDLSDSKRASSFFRNMLKHKNEIGKLYDFTKKGINGLVDQELRRELKANPNFLEELSSIIKSLMQGDDDRTDDQDDAVADVFDGDEEISSASDLKKARAEYRRILLNLSQKIGGSSKKSKPTKTSTLLEWLGDRKPNDSVLANLRGLASEAKILGSLSNPLNRFFRSINARYRKFRRLRQSENKWYNPDSALRRKIDATELDVLILTNLMISNELLSSSDIYRNTSDSWLSILEPIKSHYFNQVLVDEAPDFSPLQLGCMKLLAHPQINSFFACGDFNQRLSSEGAKGLEELKNFLPGKVIETRKINTPYRQSKKLYDFSLDILKMLGAEAIQGVPDSFMGTKDGFSPILGERLKEASLAAWIAERIVEIEKLLKVIPSIAILVPEEDYVRPVAQALQAALEPKTSAIVQACYEGQARGNEKAIRVFDIKHIKGLEFEAAFFVALDKLEALYPELLGNYLYVGTTRAATFLGVTYEMALPKSVESGLRQNFVSSWTLSGQTSPVR